MYPMNRTGKKSVKQAEGSLQPDLSVGRADMSTHGNKAFMKLKPFKILVKLTVVTYIILIGLYFFNQSTKSHLDARQAEFYAFQLIDNKYDSVSYDKLISERTAIKIANQLFSEKYGYRRAFLCKPFDTYLFNSTWFVYGPISKSKPDHGPMIIINQYTGETKLKP